MLQVQTKIICGPSRTKQSFRDEVNINSIIRRFERNGMVTHLNKTAPFFGDVSGITGYQDAMNKVIEAKQLFMKMSPDVREKFKNNPENMIQYLSDDKNKEEAIKLGIIKKPIEPPKPQTPKPTPTPTPPNPPEA